MTISEYKTWYLEKYGELPSERLVEKYKAMTGEVEPMKYKAKVKATVEMIVFINEDGSGNKEIEDVVDITEIQDFEVVDRVN